MRYLHLLAIALLLSPVSANAQAPPGPSPHAVTAGPTYKLTGARVAIAQNVRVAADEEITDGVAVFGGSLRVDGRITDSVLVVGGDVQLGPTADVRGDVVLVAGTLIRDPNARVAGSVSYVSFADWSRSTGLMEWRPRVAMGEAGRWLSLGAMLFRVAAISAVMILILLVARGAVARVGRAAAAEPLRAALIGLTAEVLFLPLILVCSIALGLTIIGLPFVFLLVPIAFAVAFLALLLGYTALACRLGEWLEDRLGWHPRSAFLATAMGLLLIVGPTAAARVLGVAPDPLRVAAFTILVVGVAFEFIVWTIGLGATLMTGFGRWNVAPPSIDVRA